MDNNKVRVSLVLESQAGIAPARRTLAILPDDFHASAGHDISRFLRQTSSKKAMAAKLVRIGNEILESKGDEHKQSFRLDEWINWGFRGGTSCLLDEAGLGCTWLDSDDSVETKAQNDFIVSIRRSDAGRPCKAAYAGLAL